MWPNPQKTADLVTFNEEILNGKLDLLYSAYGDLVGLNFSQFNETCINIQVAHSQIEYNEAPGAEHPNDIDSEDTEISKTSVIPNFVPQVLANWREYKFLKFKA